MKEIPAASDVRLPAPPRRGRTRSRAAETAVLDAAYRLLTESGLQGTSIDSIAALSGVSKATIYKWWPSRAAVMMSAFLREASAAFPHPDFTSVESIAAALRQAKDEFRGPIGRMMSAVVAQCQSDPDLAEAFRTRYIFVRRADMSRLIRQAIKAGLLRDTDPDVLTDVLYAPIFHRLFIGHGPLTDEFIDRYLDLVLHGIATPTLATRSSLRLHDSSELADERDNVEADAAADEGLPLVRPASTGRA